ncbi:MAG: HYR domain-containing protein, partial [Planctomycetota bacterium]
VPSPRISQDKLFAFFRSIADRDIGLNEGEATIGLVLEPGEHFEPGQTVEVVQLLLRAPDAAPGSVLELCTATDIGESEIDTAVSVSRDEMTISELVEPYCTQIGVDEAPEPLQILCPEELTVPAQSGGTPVSWATSTVGGCGDVVIECSHASGSLFAVGETTVTCEAKDENGTTDTCSFVVTVAGFGG